MKYYCTIVGNRSTAMKYCCVFVLLLTITACTTVTAQPPVLPQPDYDSTLYFMMWWVGLFGAVEDVISEANYILDPARIGNGPYIKVGFTLEFTSGFPQFPSTQVQIDAEVASAMVRIDSLITNARAAGVPVSIHYFSTLHHAFHPIVNQAVALDSRNSQWYQDKSLALHWDPTRPYYWTTFSRYATEWVNLKETYFRTFGAQLAKRFFESGDIFISIDGDSELHLSDFRSDGIFVEASDLADYSPFAVAEFRDWLAHRGEYCDVCSSYPNAKYKGQGKPGVPSYENEATPAAFNAQWGTNFLTWDVEGYDSAVGQPISVGFQAPALAGIHARYQPLPTSPPFFVKWLEFRQFMVGNVIQDFMKWMTSGVYTTTELIESDRTRVTSVTLPSNRIYASQIASEHVWVGTLSAPSLRYIVDGGGMLEGDVRPSGSPGWTAFNHVDGSVFNRTTDQAFFDRISGLGSDVNWGIFEWNPYFPSNASPPTGPLWAGLPCTNIVECIVSEITNLRQYKPHILVPWPYLDLDLDPTNPPIHVKGTHFETALRQFISANKYTPRHYAPGTIFTPPQVEGVTGSYNNQGGVDLSWNSNIFEGVYDFLWTEWPQFFGFLLYRSTNADMSGQVLVTTTNVRENSYRDVPSSLNQRYYYRVRALHNNGNFGEHSPMLVQDVCAQLGDMNGSGTIDSDDAEKALRLYLGLDSPGACGSTLANVYKPVSTGITPMDALTLLKQANGLIGSLPVE